MVRWVRLDSSSICHLRQTHHRFYYKPISIMGWAMWAHTTPNHVVCVSAWSPVHAILPLRKLFQTTWDSISFAPAKRPVGDRGRRTKGLVVRSRETRLSSPRPQSPTKSVLFTKSEFHYLHQTLSKWQIPSCQVTTHKNSPAVNQINQLLKSSSTAFWFLPRISNPSKSKVSPFFSHKTRKFPSFLQFAYLT